MLSKKAQPTQNSLFYSQCTYKMFHLVLSKNTRRTPIPLTWLNKVICNIMQLKKLNDLNEWSLKREGLSYLACNDRNAFFTSEHQNRYKLGRVKMCEALT